MFQLDHKYLQKLLNDGCSKKFSCCLLVFPHSIKFHSLYFLWTFPLPFLFAGLPPCYCFPSFHLLLSCQPILYCHPSFPPEAAVAVDSTPDTFHRAFQKLFRSTVDHELVPGNLERFTGALVEHRKRKIGSSAFLRHWKPQGKSLHPGAKPIKDLVTKLIGKAFFHCIHSVKGQVIKTAWETLLQLISITNYGTALMFLMESSVHSGPVQDSSR